MKSTLVVTFAFSVFYITGANAAVNPTSRSDMSLASSNLTTSTWDLTSGDLTSGVHSPTAANLPEHGHLIAIQQAENVARTKNTELVQEYANAQKLVDLLFFEVQTTKTDYDKLVAEIGLAKKVKLYENLKQQNDQMRAVLKQNKFQEQKLEEDFVYREREH